MDAAQWARLKHWFDEAADSSEVIRAEVLRRAQAESPMLAAELRTLLTAHDAPQLITRAVIDQASAQPARVYADSVGPYRLLRELGRGGTGIVFLAERVDDEFHRPVALKVLRIDVTDDSVRSLLTEERRVLSQLQHPNIAALLDWGDTAEGTPWLAMEYVEGETIDKYCASRALDLAATLGVFRQVAEAVQYAHRRLLVHRDLKPANILVTASGTVKLLDFGISRPIESAQVTQLALRRYTPAYASPEQIAGEPITAATDVYALGLVLYELVSGVVPCGSGSRDDLARRTSDRMIDPPSAVGGTSTIPARALHGDMDRLIQHALERHPDRRYPSVEQLLADLDRFVCGYPIQAVRTTWPTRARKFVSRNRLAVALSAATVLALVSGTAIATWNARVARREQAIADRRFQSLQALARSVIFDLHDAIRGIPGTVDARRALVATAVKYLDDLHSENIGDRGLRIELAAGYIRMAYVQGGVAGVNLGQTDGAVKNYRTALGLLDLLWRERPDDRQVGAMRFPAAYNLSMLINDPQQGLAFVQPYADEADGWRLRDQGTSPKQTSYLLHMAMGRMHRLMGGTDQALAQFALAESIRLAMMPGTARDRTARPMFGAEVDVAQGLFDGGLIAFWRAETLLLANDEAGARLAADQAAQLFGDAVAAGRSGPSDRRMAARTAALRAETLSRLGHHNEADTLAAHALEWSRANTADGSATAQRDLAETHQRMAHMHAHRGRWRAASAAVGEAIRVIRDATAYDPSFTLLQVMQASMLADQASYLSRLGQDAAAAAALDARASLVAAVADQAPSWRLTTPAVEKRR